MFKQTSMHAAVVISIALRGCIVSWEFLSALVMFSIAVAAAVEKIQAKPSAFVISVERNSRCENTVAWLALELKKARVFLLKNEEKKTKA